MKKLYVGQRVRIKADLGTVYVIKRYKNGTKYIVRFDDSSIKPKTVTADDCLVFDKNANKLYMDIFGKPCIYNVSRFTAFVCQCFESFKFHDLVFNYYLLNFKKKSLAASLGVSVDEVSKTLKHAKDIIKNDLDLDSILHRVPIIGNMPLCLIISNSEVVNFLHTKGVYSIEQFKKVKKPECYKGCSDDILKLVCSYWNTVQSYDLETFSE